MPRPLRVLFVEDSEDDMFFELQALKANDFDPDFERVETLAALSAALDREVWDVVISDHSLPGFTSFHALELMNRRQMDIPFIIVSGVIGEETAVRAMKLGASDYVMKNALVRLAPSIEREVREAGSRRVRRQAEKALRRSQHDLNDFFENAPVAMHWAAPDGIIVRANWELFRLLGCDQRECVGHPVSNFFVEEEAAEDVLKRLQDGQALNHFDARLRRPDGGIRDVRINANALLDDGKYLRSRWFIMDVTERKQFEMATAYLGAIVENSEDAVIGMDLRGAILTWNAGATRMYGYTAEEIRGRSIHALIPPSRAEEPLESYTHILAGLQVEQQETIRLKKNCQTIPVSVRLSPIKNAYGMIIGISAIEQDITARKREEEEKLELIQELSQALANVKTLRGLLAICASCKRIRDDDGSWNRLETYIAEHSRAEFTHGLCPDCATQLADESAIKS